VIRAAEQTKSRLRVGGVNVKGGGSLAAGSLLLGQSFLQRFKSWSMDNDKHVLVLEQN
jgi:predicted aspartyl protease